MFKFFKSITKELSGNIITIGIDDKILTLLKQNKKVNIYDINKAPGISLFQRKKRITSSGKKINIKKLYKYFNKKSIDFIICDYEEIVNYYKYVFRDSIYLNNKKIYYYAKKDIDIEYMDKYKRYLSKVTIKQFEDYNVIIIDNSNSKTNRFKNVIYYIGDTINNFIDFISNIMVG